MFGGIGFLLNGNLFVGVRKDSSACGSARSKPRHRCPKLASIPEQ
jgi:hypothetical protein